MKTHVRAGLDAVQDTIGERVTAEVVNNILGARRLHDSGEDALYLVPSLLDRVYVSLRRTALEART